MMQLFLCIFPTGMTLLHSIVRKTLKRPPDSEEKDRSELVIPNLKAIADAFKLAAERGANSAQEEV